MNKTILRKNNQQSDSIQYHLQDEDLEYDEYFDDEPQRKPKGGRLQMKFRTPKERD